MSKIVHHTLKKTENVKHEFLQTLKITKRTHFVVRTYYHMRLQQIL